MPESGVSFWIMAPSRCRLFALRPYVIFTWPRNRNMVDHCASRRPAPQRPHTHPSLDADTNPLLSTLRGRGFLDNDSRLKALKSVQRAFRRPDRRKCSSRPNRQVSATRPTCQSNGLEVKISVARSHTYALRRTPLSRSRGALRAHARALAPKPSTTNSLRWVVARAQVPTFISFRMRPSESLPTGRAFYVIGQATTDRRAPG